MAGDTGRYPRFFAILHGRAVDRRGKTGPLGSMVQTLRGERNRWHL